MFEHLRFYSNGFPLWCNVSIRFCCMVVSLMTTGHSWVHFQTNFVVFFCNFCATRGFPLVKKIIIMSQLGCSAQMLRNQMVDTRSMAERQVILL